MRTEDEQFKELLKELKQQHKTTQFELMLRNENKLLEFELQQYKNDNSLLYAQNIAKIEEIVELKFNIEDFMKREAVTFMRTFKESCKDKEITEEIQVLVNNFIFKLTHCLFLSKRR